MHVSYGHILAAPVFRCCLKIRGVGSTLAVLLASMLTVLRVNRTPVPMELTFRIYFHFYYFLKSQKVNYLNPELRKYNITSIWQKSVSSSNDSPFVRWWKAQRQQVKTFHLHIHISLTYQQKEGARNRYSLDGILPGEKTLLNHFRISISNILNNTKMII